jgi:hypothetical protein
MASNLYNPGLGKLLDGTIDFENDTINVLLVDTSHTFDKTHDFVSDIVANEASGTGYARKTLANAAIALDAANDRVEFDADNPSYTALDAGTIAAAIVFKQVTNDADSPLIAQIDFADLVTNGSDVELQINSEGLFYVTNNIT